MEIVLAHSNTDFDALASQLAVTKLRPGVRMVPGYPLAANIREFLALYRDSLPIVDLQYLDADKVTHVYVVDCQHAERLDEVGRRLISNKHCSYTVFDHHLSDPNGLLPDARNDSVVRQLGSCSSVLVDLLREKQVCLTALEATLMLIGIYEDTGCLTYGGTTETDALCVAYLLSQGADLNQVTSFTNPKLDMEQMELFQSLMLGMKFITVSSSTIVIGHAERDKYIEGLATLTRRLLEVNAADAAVSVVKMRDRICIVARSDTPSINVRLLAREFGGDGHVGAASAVTKTGTVAETVQLVEDALKKYAQPPVCAADIMLSHVPTVKIDLSMDEAWRIMLRYGQNGLVVLEDGEICGMISRRDVDKSIHHKLSHAPVKGFMSRPVITIEEGTPINEIQSIMASNDIGHLPVVDSSGRLCGIVTRAEVLREMYGNHTLPSREDRAPQEIVEKRIHLEEQLKKLDASTRWLFLELGEMAARLGMVAYAVGGCVRDMMLGRQNFDLDFVIEGSAIRLAEALESAYPGRFQVMAKHDRFQTATLSYYGADHREVDLSTARIEYYEFPAALPTVEASRLEQDLYRRDFTINALAIELNPQAYGQVVDFFNGLEDLDEGLIRILHPFSFIEDPTRIIRAARFASRLKFQMEERTRLQAQRAISMGVFDDLGGFRLKEELKIILESEQRLKALDLLNELGSGLRYLAKELTYTPRTRRLLRLAERLMTRNPISHCWVVYLGILMEGLSDSQLESTLERLYLANNEREWIRAGLSLPQLLYKDKSGVPLSRSEIYHLLHGHSDQSLAMAACLAKPASEVRRHLKLYLEELRNVRTGISGADLLKLGFPRGPQIKSALVEVHNAKLDGLLATAEEELEFVRQHFPQFCSSGL